MAPRTDPRSLAPEFLALLEMHAGQMARLATSLHDVRERLAEVLVRADLAPAVADVLAAPIRAFRDEAELTLALLTMPPRQESPHVQ